MCSLPDTTKSNSDSDFDNETQSSEDFIGWNDELSDSKLDLYLKNKKLETNLIQLANDKISLVSYFKKYEIDFKEQYSPSGWTHKALCPFPDHNEKTASFSYNPQEDRCYCFGCQRGGKVVQFIANMENKPTLQVARELVKNYLQEGDIISEVQDNNEQDKILDILVDYSKHLATFLSKYNTSSAIKYSEQISWPIDSYIRNHLPSGSINIDQLIGRVNLSKEYLEAYEG